MRLALGALGALLLAGCGRTTLAVPCSGDADCAQGQICLESGVCGVDRGRDTSDPSSGGSDGTDEPDPSTGTTGSGGSDGTDSTSAGTDTTGSVGPGTDSDTDGDIPDGGECQINADCRNESICNDGICTFIGECVQDWQCRNGQTCEEGVCIGEPQPSGPPIPCEINQDCPREGMFCFEGFCRDGVECLEHEHCPPDRACFFRRCWDPFGTP